MEIKLSDEDFERLATVLERRITDRVIGRVMQSHAWDAMSEEAKRIALVHIGSDTFRMEAVDAMQKRLEDKSQDILRQIVREAVAKVHADDPELRKAAARGVYAAAAAAAERLRSPYED